MPAAGTLWRMARIPADNRETVVNTAMTDIISSAWRGATSKVLTVPTDQRTEIMPSARCQPGKVLRSHRKRRANNTASVAARAKPVGTI